jgi:YhcH/YjgK/YiaL family protein
MIVDVLAHLGLYASIGDRLKAAVEFMQETDLAALPLGKHDIVGDVVFAIVSEYETKPETELLWEFHNRYIDLQHLIAGKEHIGYCNAGYVDVLKPYDESADIAFGEASGDFVTLLPDNFAILFPHDAHKPCVMIDGPTPVRKIVIKIRV